jgi:hypothetical protein
MKIRVRGQRSGLSWADNLGHSLLEADVDAS